MFPLLLALQTNPLFARAIEKVLSGCGVAAVSIKEIPTADAESTGATAIAFGAVHPAGGPGSGAVEMRIIADILVECATRIGPNPVTRNHLRRLLNEWLPNPGIVLHNRLYEQGAGKSRA